MKTFYIFECNQKLLDRIYPSISSTHILSSSFLAFKIKKKSGVFLLSFGNYVILLYSLQQDFLYLSDPITRERFFTETSLFHHFFMNIVFALWNSFS